MLLEVCTLSSLFEAFTSFDYLNSTKGIYALLQAWDLLFVVPFLDNLFVNFTL